MTSPEGALHSHGRWRLSARCKPSSLVVACRRLSSLVVASLGSFRKGAQAQVGRRRPAAMERDSVGQTFLSALGDVRRQECPRHSGAPFVDGHRSCRHLSIPVGSSGSTGSTGSTGGLEDEDENQPISSPVAFDKV